MIKEFLDSIQQRFADAFSGLADYAYLGGWYLIGFLVLMAALIVGYFFNFKWVRGLFGVIVLMMGALLAGMQLMFNRQRGETQSYRDKIAELKRQQKEKGNGSWFS